MKSPCILFHAVNQVQLGETDIPAPAEGEVLVETAFTCISPGTELRCLAGRQRGAPDFPFIPGYALTGRVRQCGPKVEGLREGQPVFGHGTQKTSVSRCWGGHTALAVVAATSLLPLPEGISLLEASVIRLAAIAYRGVRLAKAQPHDTVLCIGLGPIGLCSAMLHHLTGARVVALDISEERVELARSVGLEAHNSRAGIVSTVKQILPEGADVVVDSTGYAPVLQEAVACGRNKPWTNAIEPNARLVVQGSYATEVVFPVDEAFMREMEVYFPRDSQRRDEQVCLDLLQRGKLRLQPLVGGIFAPRECSEVYARLASAKGAFLTAAFDWTKW